MTDPFISLSYWKVTKNIYYSLLFILPMLFLYEFMCWYQFIGSSVEIRNSADVLLRQLFARFGRHSEFIYGLILFVVFLVIMYFNRNSVKEGRLKFYFLFVMLAESVLWCFGFIIIMSVSEQLLLSILERNIIPEQFYLAIGAGIWEELLFRIGAIGMIILILIHIIGYSGTF